MTPEKLFTDGNILREHFMTAGFPPESVAANAVVAGGILLFRGADAAGHTTTLLLLGTFQMGENNRRVLAPSALSLIYATDARNPDIFSRPKGSF